MSPREPLEQALAAGTQLKEVPELAAFAPSERFTSSPVLGQALAARVVTAMDQAGREGFALDQPPRRQGPSLATLGVFGGLAMILGLIAVGAWREKRRQSHG
jgi:hypothetical protein